jgi:hypothetical protein
MGRHDRATSSCRKVPVISCVAYWPQQGDGRGRALPVLDDPLMHAVTIEGEYEKYSLTGQTSRAGSETETVLVKCDALGLEGGGEGEGGKRRSERRDDLAPTRCI